MLRYLRVVWLSGLLCAVALCAATANAAAGGFKTLYSFRGGSDGRHPAAPLIEDKAGNFYGTTQFGGSAVKGRRGRGTVFRLGSDGTETVLYAFHSIRSGTQPQAGLVADEAGDLFGTTEVGGSKTWNAGSVFELAPDGTQTVLHRFGRPGDGGYPFTGLVADKDGNLYGTTADGGEVCDCGVVYKIASSGKESIVYSFQGGSDGECPFAPLIVDRSGNLYGTTELGGSGTCSCGTVFKLAPDGKETVLYSFEGNQSGDGAYPSNGASPSYSPQLRKMSDGCSGKPQFDS